MEGDFKKCFGSLVEEDSTESSVPVDPEMIVLGDSSNSGGTEILDMLNYRNNVKQETSEVETKSQEPKTTASEPDDTPIARPSQELKIVSETGQPANHQRIRVHGSEFVINPSDHTLIRFAAAAAAGQQAFDEPDSIAKQENVSPTSSVELQKTLTIIGVAFENFKKEMVAQFSGQMPRETTNERRVKAKQPEDSSESEEDEPRRTKRVDRNPVMASSSSSQSSSTQAGPSRNNTTKKVNKSTRPSERTKSPSDSLTSDTDESLFSPPTPKHFRAQPVTTNSRKRKESERNDSACACRIDDKNLELIRSRKIKDSLYRGLVKEMVKSVADPSGTLDWPEEGGIKELAGQFESYYTGRMDLKPRLKSIITQRFYSYYRNNTEDKLRLNYQPFFECLCELYCPHKPAKVLKGWIDLVEIIHLKPKEIFMDYWRSMYMFCNKSYQNVLESVRLYDDVNENSEVASTLEEISADLLEIRQEIFKRMGRREEACDIRKPRKSRKTARRWEPDD